MFHLHFPLVSAARRAALVSGKPLLSARWDGGRCSSYILLCFRGKSRLESPSSLTSTQAVLLLVPLVLTPPRATHTDLISARQVDRAELKQLGQEGLDNLCLTCPSPPWSPSVPLPDKNTSEPSEPLTRGEREPN